MNFTNSELWNALRAKYPSFKAITSEATSELFTEKGFSDLSRNNINALNAFFELSMRVVFQKVDIAKIHTRLQEAGLVESYTEAMGGYIQRISIEAITGVSPAFTNLVDGSSVDPWIVRKPESKERFFGQNFDFQNLITIQEYQAKTMFIGENSMSAYLTGIINGLELGYKQQLEVNIYECLHACINDTLQDSQVIELASWTDAGVTDAELKDLIAQLQDIATEMNVSITQPGFNANGFKTAYDPEDFVVLMRAGIKNKIQRQLMVGAYNPDTLTIPFKIVEVADFGGVVHKMKDGNNEFATKPHYNELGAVDGFEITEGPATGQVKPVDWEFFTTEDTDEKVLAVVAQKGLIFETIQNPYTVKPIPNPRGEYTNYWCNAKNNSIKYDKNYGCIVVKKPTA